MDSDRMALFMGDFSIAKHSLSTKRASNFSLKETHIHFHACAATKQNS